jgi:hypothetical protein
VTSRQVKPRHEYDTQDWSSQQPNKKPRAASGRGSVFLVNAQSSNDERLAKQKELDDRCYAVRQILIEPLRQEQVANCVVTEKSRSDAQQYCQQSLANFGERMGRQQALFTDIQECDEAFKFQQSTRSGS